MYSFLSFVWRLQISVWRRALPRKSERGFSFVFPFYPSVKHLLSRDLNTTQAFVQAFKTSKLMHNGCKTLQDFFLGINEYLLLKIQMLTTWNLLVGDKIIFKKKFVQALKTIMVVNVTSKVIDILLGDQRIRTSKSIQIGLIMQIADLYFVTSNQGFLSDCLQALFCLCVN